MSLLGKLDELFNDAKETAGSMVETPGIYEAELISTKFDGTNKWKDGTPVPRVNLTFKVVEGDLEGDLIFVNLNLGGRTPENTRISLEVFASTVKKLGVDLKGKDIKETIQALGEQKGAKANVEVKQNGEYLNTKVV